MLGHNHSFRATLFHSSDRTAILQQQEKAPCFPYAFILAHDNCTFSPSFSLFVASSGPNLSVPAPYCSALHPHRFPLNAQAFPHLSITNSPFRLEAPPPFSLFVLNQGHSLLSPTACPPDCSLALPPSPLVQTSLVISIPTVPSHSSVLYRHLLPLERWSEEGIL